MAHLKDGTKVRITCPMLKGVIAKAYWREIMGQYKLIGEDHDNLGCFERKDFVVIKEK